MISPNEFGQGMAKAASHNSTMGKVSLDDLADKWSLESEDEPICAACGKRIRGVDEDGMAEVPIRLFRQCDNKGLALHLKCFAARQVK